MQRDLSRIRQSLTAVRRILVTASIVTVIGLAGVVGARTVERRQSSTVSRAFVPPARPTVADEAKAAAGPANIASVELLHDLPAPVVSSRIMMMEVTAYCACPKCCGPNAIGITASGRDVSYNGGKFVAADRHFAFGTKLLIPGYHSDAVEVIDRGGAIKGQKLDVFFPTHEAALQWGRQIVPVTIFD